MTKLKKKGGGNYNRLKKLEEDEKDQYYIQIQGVH